MDKDNEVRILRSYSKVWKIERVFYNFGGFNLPNPVALNTLIYFMIFEVIMVALKNVILIRNIPAIYSYGFIPGGLAWFFNNKTLDGKNPLAFLKSVILHYAVTIFKGSRISRFKYMGTKNKRARFANKISYRIIKPLRN